MESTSPPTPDLSADDRSARLDFFVLTPLRLASRIQARLGVDELNYLHVAGQAHHDARAYFLYGALDEVIKAAIAAMRWREFLKDSPTEKDPKFSEGDRARMARQVLASTASDQALWFRKLIELLVDLVLFSSTNEQDYYRCYLTGKSVSAAEDQKRDVTEFFACQIENAAYGLRLDLDALRDVGARIDVARAWFLQGPGGLDGTQVGNRRFSSFRSRFIKAHDVAAPETRLILGASYAPAYSRPSGRMHWTIGEMSQAEDVSDVERVLVHIGLLGLCICHLAEDLVGDRQASTAMGTRQAIEDSDVSRLYAIRFQRQFDVGDIVLVDGEHVCQVTETARSRYGNTSFRCRFLGRPPIRSIPSDWCPSPGVQRLFARSDLRPKLRQTLADRGASQAELARVDEMDDTAVGEVLSASFAELTRAGILPAALRGDGEVPVAPKSGL
jgi:hypothetical protein